MPNIIPIISDKGISIQTVFSLIIFIDNSIPVIIEIMATDNLVIHKSFHLSNLSEKAPPKRDIPITPMPLIELIKPMEVSDFVRSKTIQARAITLI